MIVLLLILGLLPGFAWLVFYVEEEETHPEPRQLILFAFVAGMAAGLVAVLLENLLAGAGAGVGVGELSLAALTAFALIEEAVKFGAAYLAIGKSRLARNPVDLMIYLIVAALGFATLENIGALVSLWLNTHAATGSIATGLLEALSLRFVGATLLHSLTSGVVGYYWALGMLRKSVTRHLIVGIAIASVLHLFFNLLILNYGNVAYALVFLTLLGFFVLNDFEKLKITIK
ncbi:MAG: PrsW family glutamic-type intramembrane protease [Minisyncoccia bacterium]|jgi:RsiW-degrading membrane proteinase PrsW (M82 family)